MLIVLIANSIYQITNTNNTIEKIISENIENTISYLNMASYNSIVSDENREKLVTKRLRDNCKYIEKLLNANLINNKVLDDITSRDSIFKINIFDNKGEIIYFSRHKRRHHGRGKHFRKGGRQHRHHYQNNQKHKPFRDIFLKKLFEEGRKEVVIGFNQGGFGRRNKFGYGYKTDSNKAIIMQVEADELYRIKQEFSINKLFNEAVEYHNIEFIFLEENHEILISSINPELDKKIVDQTLKRFLNNQSNVISTDYKTIYVARQKLKQFPNTNLFAGIDISNLSELKYQNLINNLLTGVLLLVVLSSLLGIVFYLLRIRIDKENLGEKVSYLSKMSSGIAHEIRNPLNSISIFIGRLKHEFAPKNPEERQEFEEISSTVKNEIDRLNKIIVDFISLNKPVKPELIETNIYDIINETKMLTENEFENTNISIEGDRELIYRVDSEKFKDILDTLLKNSVEAIKEVEEGKVIVKYALEKEKLSIMITDNGVGMDNDNVKNIFTPYYTTKENGTGIGLSITKTFVEQLGGTIKVSSESGKGTTFRLIF